jgi:hypothetical protein
MLEVTKNVIEEHFKDEAQIIYNASLAIQKALEDLYESGKAQLPEEAVLEDIAKNLDISERIRANKSFGEKLEILFNEYLPFYQEIRAKYSDFMPSEIIAQIRSGEKYIEGFKHYITIATAFDTASKEPKESSRFCKIYFVMFHFSDLVEQYVSYFPDWLLNICETTAKTLLTDSIHQLDRTDLSQEMTNYLKLIKNIARGILWQIEDYKKDKKYPVEELLNWLELAPRWAGDDFEECLDYVNQARK